jgi:hypothetical protein
MRHLQTEALLELKFTTNQQKHHVGQDLLLLSTLKTSLQLHKALRPHNQLLNLLYNNVREGFWGSSHDKVFLAKVQNLRSKPNQLVYMDNLAGIDNSIESAKALAKPKMAKKTSYQPVTPLNADYIAIAYIKYRLDLYCTFKTKTVCF